jgi:hypothetical protein
VDQTEVAVCAGFIAAPISAVVLRGITGWPLWAAVPLGLIGGFLGATVAVYVAIGILGKRAERKKREKERSANTGQPQSSASRNQPGG